MRSCTQKINIDIIKVIATYNYDAWGNIIPQSGTMATANPFRYRGYYYDTETGFYYLQTRYYDPTTRLFINADNYDLIGTLSLNGELNLYTYCVNNPVMFTDETGEDIFKLISNFFWLINNTGSESRQEITVVKYKIAGMEQGYVDKKENENKKIITFYTKTSINSWEMSAGVEINIDGYGVFLETGTKSSIGFMYGSGGMVFSRDLLGFVSFTTYQEVDSGYYYQTYYIHLSLALLLVGVLAVGGYVAVPA